MTLKAFFLSCTFIFFVIRMNAQDKPAYKLFDKEGKEVTFAKMSEVLATKDIVLFGEFHDNPIAHWLQLQLTKDFFARRGKDLTLGAEMFEADNQLILDEYLKGIIREKNFTEEMRLWNNYKTDYKPLVEFAKSKGLNFIATNIPRRYAAVISYKGTDSLQLLSNDSKAFIAPIPFPLDLEQPAYKSMRENMGGMHGIKPENMAAAQAAKDATMAWRIVKHWSRGKLFLHFNGSYHSDNEQGIFWYLNQYLKKVNIGTITTVLQDDISEISGENKGKAEFTIVVHADMTRTY